MKDIFLTRWMHLKQYWVGLLFWLIFPVIAAILISFLVQSAEKETKVPIGIVAEEESSLTDMLLHEIAQESTLQVYRLQASEALHLLEIHKLDSVFVINKGFEEQIRRGDREQLITSYRSDLSFAYSPVKEMIISLVQQETSRSKAAYTVKHLTDSVGAHKQWSWDEIVDTSKQVQKEENLFLSTFSFFPAETEKKSVDHAILDIWAIWALLNLLVTFLLTDWVIKEKENNVSLRFSFMRFSYPGYLVSNAILYFILQLCFDMAAGFIFHYTLQVDFHFSTLFSLLGLQISFSSAAFLLALLFKNPYMFYSIAIAITLLAALFGGAIFPQDHLASNYPWIAYVNPLYDFLHGSINYQIPAIGILLIGSWYLYQRKKQNG